MSTQILSEFGSVDYEVGIKVSARAIRKARRKQCLYRIGMTEKLPKNRGNQVNFDVWDNLAPATAPLMPSVSPTGAKQSATDVVAQLEIYGNWAPFNKHIQLTYEDNYTRRLVDNLAFNMADSLETVNVHFLKKGTSSFLSNAESARTDIDKVFTLETLRDAIGDLEANNAEPIQEMLTIKPNIDAVGIEEAYFAFVHSHLERVVRDLPGFVHASRYPDSMKQRMPQEIGSVENVRFIRFNYLTPWAGAGDTAPAGIRTTAGGKADVYPVLIFAKDAFGVTTLESTEHSKVMIATPQVNGSSDQLGQRGSAGWLTYHAISIIDNDKMTRIESAAPKGTAV
jgi:N4-gp56 family major capsid protein